MFVSKSPCDAVAAHYPGEDVPNQNRNGYPNEHAALAWIHWSISLESHATARGPSLKGSGKSPLAISWRMQVSPRPVWRQTSGMRIQITDGIPPTFGAATAVRVRQRPGYAHACSRHVSGRTCGVSSRVA
jgi:hypothetical protein